MSKSCLIKDHVFSLLFPKDSTNLKSLDIGFWEVGAKRPLNGKFDRQTDKKKTKIRLIESIGPEGQCFENLVYRFLPLRWTRLILSHMCKDQEKPITLTSYIKDSHS